MQEMGLQAPLALRPVPPERAAQAVVDAIREDRPEVIVSRRPLRPLFALAELAPEAGPWLAPLRLARGGC